MTIKEAREHAGFTQAKIAKLLGVPKRTYEDWEAGKRNPKKGREYIAELIAGLGILSQDGIDCYLDPDDEDFDADYVRALWKHREAQRLSEWGTYGETFAANWRRIPDSIKSKLTAQELAELVDAIKAAYDDGKQSA